MRATGRGSPSAAGPCPREACVRPRGDSSDGVVSTRWAVPGAQSWDRIETPTGAFQEPAGAGSHQTGLREDTHPPGCPPLHGSCYGSGRAEGAGSLKRDATPTSAEQTTTGASAVVWAAPAPPSRTHKPHSPPRAPGLLRGSCQRWGPRAGGPITGCGRAQIRSER